MTLRAFIEFSDVSKTYDGRTLAVSNLSCAVTRGEFLTFLGPSGSGKTTALMMLAGFEQPSAGELRLNGRPLGPIPAHRRNMGVVFQNYALFPHLSVAENIAFPLRVRGVAAGTVRERVRQVLALIRLQGYEDRRPAQLSGGQQQRAAIARALAGDPRFLLADEPTGNVDSLMARQVMDLLEQINEMGTTVIMVTHDPELARRAHRNVHIVDGQISDFKPYEPRDDMPAVGAAPAIVAMSPA